MTVGNDEGRKQCVALITERTFHSCDPEIDFPRSSDDISLIISEKLNAVMTAVALNGVEIDLIDYGVIDILAYEAIEISDINRYH